MISVDRLGHASEPEKLGRNPKTGAPVEVPAKRIAYFKPGKELKDLVNGESSGGQSGPQETAHR
jgi:hypothetical protein